MSDYIDRPLKDRMKAFFLSEDMADVCFNVGLDGVKERIPAYKVLLATASEVFHGMLYGHFEVPETIDVDDTTPETFKAVLSYIYTDTVDLTPDNAFPVLYLAKKYLLNQLSGTVSAYVTTAYDGENIAKVLEHLDLVDEEHSESIWQAIERHAETLLQSPEFLCVSHAVLCDLLHRDLNADEFIIFDSTVAWTKAECTRKQLTFPDNARTVLANALNFIRFPLMSIEEFTNGPASSGLLSDQELLGMYKWYGSSATPAPMVFSTTPRRRPVLTCNRFDPSKMGYHGWFFEGDCNRFITFSASTRVLVHGVGICGTDGRSCDYEVTVSLAHADTGETLATTLTDVTTDASEDIYKVLFADPVKISPSTLYRINVDVNGPGSCYGVEGRRRVVCNDGTKSVTFTFPVDTGSRTYPECDIVEEGPVPVIFFSFV